MLWLMLNEDRAAGPRFVGTGTVEYRATHPLQVVVGTSNELRVVADENKRGLTLTARVVVTSFCSGNADRDAQIAEAMDAVRHPVITVHAVLPKALMPGPGEVSRLGVLAQVEAHGVTVAHPIRLTLDFTDPHQPAAAFELRESLRAHHIRAPRILLMRVRDELAIWGRVQLQQLPAG